MNEKTAIKGEKNCQNSGLPILTGGNFAYFNEDTSRQARGIFVGKEIYYTGGVCTPPANKKSQTSRSKRC